MAGAARVIEKAGSVTRTTVRNVTAGKGGVALAIFGVLMIGWLFVTGRLGAVGRVINEGPSALDQILGGKQDAAGGIKPLPTPATIPVAPVVGIFPGGSLPGTPPIAPGPGAVPRRVRASIPNRSRPGSPNVEVEVLAGKGCRERLKALVKTLGYSDAEAEAFAYNACAQVAPVPAGG